MTTLIAKAADDLLESAAVAFKRATAEKGGARG